MNKKCMFALVLLVAALCVSFNWADQQVEDIVNDYKKKDSGLAFLFETGVWNQIDDVKAEKTAYVILQQWYSTKYASNQYNVLSEHQLKDIWQRIKQERSLRHLHIFSPREYTALLTKKPFERDDQRVENILEDYKNNKHGLVDQFNKHVWAKRDSKAEQQAAYRILQKIYNKKYVQQNQPLLSEEQLKKIWDGIYQERYKNLLKLAITNEYENTCVFK